MHSPLTRIVSCIAALAVCAAARAQDINVDIGDDPTGGSFGSPAIAHGAAAGNPGLWNRATDGTPGLGLPPPSALPWYVIGDLAGLNGAPTGVALFATVSASSNSIGDFEFNNAGTNASDQALMDDFADVGGAGSMLTFTFANLQSGVYDVYTYAWAPDSASFTSSVHVANSSSANPQSCGGAWPGSHQLGVTYTKHSIALSGGTLTIRVTALTGFGSVNAIQLDLQGGGTEYPGFCFGDGTQAPNACPCYPDVAPGASGNGCPNSFRPEGAHLSATGTIAPDTIAFTADIGAGYVGYAMMAKGDALANAPFLHGDGLRCWTGNQIRFGGHFAGTAGAPIGTWTYPNVLQPQPVSGVSGQLAGTLAYYQVIYRNIAPHCTVAGFNTTNGVLIPW